MDVFLANAGVKIRSKHARLSPPLGLAYIAAVLQQNGFDVAAQDFNSLKSDEQYLSAILEKQAPRILGISVQTETYPNGLKLAVLAKQIVPNTIVVMGGPHASAMFADVLQEPSVDIVARGEGESTMVELANYFIRRTGNLSQIKGIAYRQDGHVHVTADRLFIANPDELPFPARELFPLPLYEQPLQVLLSRGGCPFNCCFCAVNTIWQGGRRFRSNENVIREILSLYENSGEDDISFSDDTFTLNRARILNLCEQSAQIREVFPWEWGCTTRVDLVDTELLLRMRDAGCYAITFGVETGSQQVLSAIDKKITLAQVKRSVDAALQVGLAVQCSFMFPHPQDTAETVREQKRFMQDLVAMGAKVSLAFTTPFPGTSYYEHRDELGIRLLTNQWEEFDAKHLIIETRNLKQAQLNDLFQEMVQAIGLHHD